MMLNGNKEISNNPILSQMFSSQPLYTGMNSMVVDRNKSIYKKLGNTSLNYSYSTTVGYCSYNILLMYLNSFYMQT